MSLKFDFILIRVCTKPSRCNLLRRRGFEKADRCTLWRFSGLGKGLGSIFFPCNVVNMLQRNYSQMSLSGARSEASIVQLSGYFTSSKSFNGISLGWRKEFDLKFTILLVLTFWAVGRAYEQVAHRCISKHAARCKLGRTDSFM